MESQIKLVHHLVEHVIHFQTASFASSSTEGLTFEVQAILNIGGENTERYRVTCRTGDHISFIISDNTLLQVINFILSEDVSHLNLQVPQTKSK